MRNMILILSSVAAAFMTTAGAPIVAAPVPKHLMKEPENPDFAALQGKWTLTNLSFAGMQLQGDTLAQIEMTVEFKGDILVMTAAKQNMRSTTPVKFDTNTKPRRLIFGEGKATDLEGKPIDNPGAEKMGIAIYRVEGDTFIMAAKANGKEGVPEGFDGKADSDVAILTFTRVKK